MAIKEEAPMIPVRTALAAAGLAAFLAMPQAEAEETLSYQNLVTPLLASGETVLGETIVYPSGTAKVTAAIVTVPPGGETGWHTHPVPLFAYILEGTLTVDYGAKGIRVYKAGDSVLEAMNTPHDGTNKGDVPVKLLAVYMGAEGAANAAPAQH
jgi:quercetin dioxygenase-like cupin family protein